jgi:hypothetical protein
VQGEDIALNHLLEIVVLVQENVDRLLSTVYKLGIFTNINTTQHINQGIGRVHDRRWRGTLLRAV